MSLTIINDKYLNDIADALREIHGEDESVVYKPSEMAPKLQDWTTDDAKLIMRTYEGDYTNNTITALNSSAFKNYDGIQNVSMPNLTSICEWAFYNSSITSANLPNITVIPTGCFSGSGLTDYDFTNIVEVGTSGFSSARALGKNSEIHLNSTQLSTIGDSGFSSTYGGFTTINLPNLLTVGRSAFSQMNNLQSIQCDRLRPIPEYMCHNCYNLTNADFLRATSIGKFSFYDCDLQTINFPKVQEIGVGAFYNNTNLTSAVFPELAKIYCSSGSYEYGAFKQVRSLETLVLGGSEVVEIIDITDKDNPVEAYGDWTQNIFETTYLLLDGGYIYVHADLVDAYKAHTVWKYMSDKFRAIEDYPDIAALIE